MIRHDFYFFFSSQSGLDHLLSTNQTENFIKSPEDNVQNHPTKSITSGDEGLDSSYSHTTAIKDILHHTLFNLGTIFPHFELMASKIVFVRKSNLKEASGIGAQRFNGTFLVGICTLSNLLEHFSFRPAQYMSASI